MSQTPEPYLLMAGVVLVFAGQSVLLRTVSGAPEMGSRQLAAGFLLVLGAILFGWGAYRFPRPDARLDFSRKERQGGSTIRWFEPTFSTLLSVGLAGLAIALFSRTGESPLVIGLWIASMLALLLPRFWPVKFAWPPGLRDEWPYLLGLLVVLVLAVAERLYHLSTLPYNFDGDYASFGLQARALITGAQPHIFAFGWAAIPMPGFFPAALTMRLVGDSIAGLRASGVIEGILSILGVYLLARDLFRPRVGLVAAAILAVAYAHIAASREAQYIDPVPFVVFSAYFLLLGLRERRGWAIVASGFTTAFCLELYYSGRIVLPIIIFIVLYLLVFYRSSLFKRAGWLLLWLLAGLVALGPILVVSARESANVTQRSRDVFILSPTVVQHTMGVYKVSTVSAMLWEQARRTALIFHYYGDNDTQFSLRRPLLDPITAPLFTLGLGLAGFEWRRLGSALAAAWTVMGVILGCLVTVNPPFWTRLMILLPPAAILASLALEALYVFVQDHLLTNSRPLRVLAPVVLSLLLVWIGFRNWNTYVQLEGSYANSVTRAARYMMTQPATTRAYVVSDSGWTYRLREFEFLVPGRMVADITADDVKAGVARVGTPTLLILSADQAALIPLLPQFYPGGALTTAPDNDPNQVAFYAFQLP